MIDKEIIVSALPNDYKAEVVEALKAMPDVPGHETTEPFKVFFGNEIIKIPYRIYYEEPDRIAEDKLSAEQKEIINCIYTRHHNGYVRERRLKDIILSEKSYSVPFVIQLLGEYVIEILFAIKKELGRIRIDIYIDFLNQNKAFYELTRQRMISYWDCYYRSSWYKKDDYVGYQIFKFFDARLK